MARKNNNRLKQRNADIRAAFKKLKQDQPKWRYDAWLEEIARRFYLAPRTIQKILLENTEE